jgi:signal peptidase II
MNDLGTRWPATAARMPAKATYLLISLAVLGLDQWSKWLVELHLPQQTAQPVIPGLLNLTHVRNTGVAFGMFAAGGSNGSLWLTALGCAALAAVGTYFWLAPRDHRMLLSALALIVGGAVGNLLDRLASGAVTDFVDVYLGSHHWPSFNVADSAISIGIVMMALDSFRHRPHEAAEAAEAA